MSRETTDPVVRAAAFEWLRQRTTERGRPIFEFRELERGFRVGGEKVTLASVQGIWTPKLCATPISIRTAPARRDASPPYDDSFRDGQVSYQYYGDDPEHRDNAGLRRAMRTETPLAYFLGIVPNRYLALWPVFVIADDPAALEFQLRIHEHPGLVAVRSSGQSLRTPLTPTMERIREVLFRERVLDAYRTQCALCRLPVRDLLDAARIVPHDDGGPPVVGNGLSLCALHHTAFERMFLGVRPDHTVEVRSDLLHAGDHPILRHALGHAHGQKIVLPSRRADHPDPLFLRERYDRFRRSRPPDSRLPAVGPATSLPEGAPTT